MAAIKGFNRFFLSFKKKYNYIKKKKTRLARWLMRFQELTENKNVGDLIK